ncbi:MAG: 30S ribosomal protein S2 [Ilumatobacter sp.]|uniref:30S ribosomal protein S2 n=1 Tax=Ilumatobacter sp. TaxID=1967498 RepID=UPI003C73DD86
MAVISMRQMLEAGAHFGHQTRKWNPKMKRFIFGERNGIYVIDLQQTLPRVETAYGFVRDLVAGGGNILFVGTKKQAQDPIKSYADKCGMPYVNERWLGGMLTNFETISKRVGKMLEYERMVASGETEVMIKKEALLLNRELTKLQKNLGGLRDMKKAPDAVFVLDTLKEHIAVTEARKLGIPVVAVVDTNVNPEVVDYPIPGNDDAIRSNSLFARVIADAVAEGRFIAQKRNPAPEPVVEKTPEQVAEFENAQKAARDAAAQAQADRDARLNTAQAAAEAAGAPSAEAAPAAEDQSSAASDAARTPASVPAETTGPAGSDAVPSTDPIPETPAVTDDSLESAEQPTNPGTPETPETES